MFEESRESILALAHEWSCLVSGDVVDQILRYFHRLLEWNVRVNLTGARSLSDLIGDHLPDSFALSRFCPSDSNVLDVGSGGGLPGMPFSLLRPDCQVTLLEPRAKRVAFLNTAVREIGCGNAKVVRARLEDGFSSRFDVAVSRATFPPEKWIELGFTVLVPAGRLVLLSTQEFLPVSNGKRLIERSEYRTASGVARWAGCFCSTWNSSRPE
jgi:16S rRNA (guanine527-N7)-methyltransferase